MVHVAARGAMAWGADGVATSTHRVGGPRVARWVELLRRHSSARWAAALMLAGAATLGLAAPVAAEPPGRLDTPVTDTVGALTGAGEAVASAQAELQEEAAIQLWIAYVATFDGLSGEQWAADTADQSGLGGNDVLFAVAVEDRAYGYSVDEAFPLSDAEIQQVIARDVEPALGASDWPGAVVALADGLGEATTGADAGTGSGGGGSGAGTDDASPGTGPWPVLLGVGALLVGALVVVALVRRRRTPVPGGGSASHAPPEPEPIESLRQRTAGALIDADDAIRTSGQELGFAIAQFGDEAAAPFSAALTAARSDLQRAFELQRRAQQLADGVTPGDLAPIAPASSDAPGQGTDTGPATEREALEQILALCAAVDERLDAQVESFDQLRDLEQSLETVLPGLASRAAELATRLRASRATAEDLATRYPPAALATVQADLEESGERIRFAEEALQRADECVAGGDRGAAATEARAAEEAVGQVSTLLDRVDEAPSVLDLAQRAVAALMAETERDIAEAEALGAADRIGAVHHFASETLAWARTAVASGNYDPLQVRRALEDSDAALERALVGERQIAATRARAVALLPTATEAAQVSVRIVDDFIATRRGAVGAEARGRLAEAQRRLVAGRSLDDPVAALTQVQAADHLADQAHALAQQDVARYADQQRRGGGSGALGSAILGGILINSVARGGRPSGGRSGGGFRAPAGRAPGSFGGGGTRGRRGGGGRF